MDTTHTVPESARLTDDSKPLLVERAGCGWCMEDPPNLVRMPCCPTREQALQLWESFAKVYRETVS